MMKWVGIGVLVLLGVLVLAAGVGFAVLGHVELAGFVAGRASARLGRTVTIESARVAPGVWSRVVLKGVTVANVAGGSDPVMARLQEGSAEVRSWSLLAGPMELRALAVEGLSVLLEHTADGKPNWRDGPPEASSQTRKGFPSLRGLTGRGVEVVVMTREHHALTTKLEEVAFTSPADDQKTALKATGSYQGQPVSLDAALNSIDAYRDEAVPFGTVVRMHAGAVALTFDGTMTQPLNVDGLEGTLNLDAPELTPIMAVAGAAEALKLPLRLAGRFRHSGALWWWWNAAGSLQETAVNRASVGLVEGDGQRPDHVVLDLAVGEVDGDALAEAAGAGGGSGGSGGALAPSRTPGTLFDARLTAHGVTYHKVKASGVTLAGALTAGKIDVPTVELTVFGAGVQANGSVTAFGDKAGRVQAEVAVSGAEVQAIRQELGFGSVPMTGRLEGLFLLDGVAPKVSDLTRTAQVAGLMAMRGGTIAKSVVEKASLDVRALLRKAEGVSAVRCLLAGVSMRDGVGTVAPLRLKAADGTITGMANFDLNRQDFDLTIGTVAATTGPLALDVPIRVSGPFGHPSIEPAEWSAQGRAQLEAGDELGRLPGPLQAMARRYPCPR